VKLLDTPSYRRKCFRVSSRASSAPTLFMHAKVRITFTQFRTVYALTLWVQIHPLKSFDVEQSLHYDGLVNDQ
jgi:hypothetical protein